jgi:hypothetical protein
LIALTSYAWWGLQYPHCFCDITHQCFAGKKLKNLNFSASGHRIYIYIYIYILISYYVRGLQYIPPRVLALWGQNPAGSINNSIKLMLSSFGQTTCLFCISLYTISICIYTQLVVRLSTFFFNKTMHCPRS